MQIRGGKPPPVRQLADSAWELSRDAARPLHWMTHYLQHGRNAAFPCRHFGISRQSFYRWSRRYDPHHLARLEGHAHRPHRLRQPPWTAAQAEAVLALRREYPRGGKDKRVVLLRRNHLPLSTSRWAASGAMGSGAGCWSKRRLKRPREAAAGNFAAAQGPRESPVFGPFHSLGIWSHSTRRNCAQRAGWC